MTTQQRINEAANGIKNGVTIYWDTQDPRNSGAAFRDGDDSGPLEITGLSDDAYGGAIPQDGYFGTDGAYVAPGKDAVHLLFEIL